MKPAGYNRNLIGGKRPHRGISKYGNMPYSERMKLEIQEYNRYLERAYGKLKKSTGIS